MKLVIAGRKGWGMEEFEEKLASFKFRKDVILTGYLADEALAKLTGAAYAMVYPSFYEGCGVPVLEAMQAGVPVITSSNSAMSSICKTAAVYASPVVPDEWAMHMNFLYSNESYRSQLIEKGKELILPYTWEHTAKAYMDSIMKTLGA
jgi:glycosyltransferase involved in cell wall biosynthesis